MRLLSTRLLLLPCISLWALALFLIFDQTPANDSYRYLEEAKFVQEYGLDYFEKTNSAPYYWFYPIVLSQVLVFMEPVEVWDASFYLNILLYGAAAYLFYEILRWYCRPLVSFVGFLAFLFCFEMWHWTYYLLTEIPYIFLCIGFFYFLYKPKQNICYQLLSLLVFGLSILFIKPVGFIFIGLCLTGLFIRYFGFKVGKKQMLLTSSFIGIFGIGVFYLLFKSADSGLGINTYLEGFAGHFRNGDIIKDRLEYRIEQGDEHWLVFAIKLFLLRVFYFWYPLIKGYSLSHLLMNAVFLLPVFVLGFMGLIRQLLVKRDSICLSLVFIIVGFTVFHSATFLDFGHRYRSPLIWIMLFFACILLQCVWDRYQIFSLKSKK